METLTKVSEKQVKLEFQSRLTSLMKDMTQTELSKKTGLTRQAIAKYCSGKCLPTAYPLCLLANYFNVSCDYLLGREEGTRHELEAIIKSTGLTAKSLEVLMHYNRYNDMKYEIVAINTLLTHYGSSDFLTALAKYTSVPNVDADDFDDDVYSAMFPYSDRISCTPIGLRNDETEIETYTVSYQDVVYHQLVKEFDLLVDSIKNDAETKQMWIDHLIKEMKPYYKKELIDMYEASMNGEFSLDDIKCDKDALNNVIKIYSKQMAKDAEERKEYENNYFEKLRAFLQSDNAEVDG